jgi:hypothetical protein
LLEEKYQKCGYHNIIDNWNSMKYKILFILILTNFALFGQDSKTFVDTNKLWSVYWDYSAEGLPGDNYTYYIKFADDTNIIANSYKKVIRSNDSLHSSWFNYGYIRETIDKKIYYLTDNQDTVEKYIFNENAIVGDTFQSYFCTVQVDSIDSILINNKYRRRFHLMGDWMTWIEGVGSLNGFEDSGVFWCLAGGRRSLLCYNENDTLKFTNPDYSFCYQGTLDLDKTSKDKVFVCVFPNPISSSSVFEIGNFLYSDNVLEIFSVTGQKLKTIRFDKQTIINKSDLTGGLYIYRLITKSVILTGKFEVE